MEHCDLKGSDGMSKRLPLFSKKVANATPANLESMGTLGNYLLHHFGTNRDSGAL